MALLWLDDILEPTDEPHEYVGPQPCHTHHCLCGRFAKWAGDRHYYNGNFDCYSYDLLCSRCGVVTIECV